MKNKPKEPYLDGQKLFEKYFSLGELASIAMVTRWATTCGMLSKSGKEPTRMGVWKAMWRWASLKENKQRAYEIFSEYVLKYGFDWDTDYIHAVGEPFTLEEWNRYMPKVIKSAWQYPSQTLYERFLKNNGWL